MHTKKKTFKKILDDAVSVSNNGVSPDDKTNHQYIGKILSPTAGGKPAEDGSVVKLLLQKGADVCHCKQSGDSVLMACCKLGAIQSTRDILEVAEPDVIEKVLVSLDRTIKSIFEVLFDNFY